MLRFSLGPEPLPQPIAEPGRGPAPHGPAVHRLVVNLIQGGLEGKEPWEVHLTQALLRLAGLPEADRLRAWLGAHPVARLGELLRAAEGEELRTHLVQRLLAMGDPREQLARLPKNLRTALGLDPATPLFVLPGTPGGRAPRGPLS